MAETLKGVVINNPIQTSNLIAKTNADIIVEFFSLYLKDKDTFYSLWLQEDTSKIVTPFAAAHVVERMRAESRAAGKEGLLSSVELVYTGWDAIRKFYDPIFAREGSFEWTIDEFIVGEDPNIIVTRSKSVVDNKVPWTDGTIKHVKYKGTYIQIFTFKDGQVTSFTEYFDTAMLNKLYFG